MDYSQLCFQTVWAVADILVIYLTEFELCYLASSVNGL